MKLFIDVNAAVDHVDSDLKEIKEEDVKTIINEVLSEVLPEDMLLKKKIEFLNTTIEYLNYNLLSTFIKQGIEYGILTLIDRYNPTMEELYSLIKYPNKDFVINYVNTAIKLNILKEEDNKIKVNENFEIKIKMPKFGKIINDYIMKYNYITYITRYALISYNHPKICINFKKDPDIWDMILGSNYFNLHREVALELLKIENDSYILDVGCGSRSPAFFIKHIFPKGFYMGVDISKGLLEIAKNRIKRNGLDCYELKCMDFSVAIPKEKYDYVICSHVLKYAPSIKIFLNKMMKALRPGGKIYLAEEFILDKDDNIYVEVFEFYNKLNNRFMRYYSLEEIKDILERLGYDTKIERAGKGIVIIEKI
ncbi:hypothetical protein Metin_0493 [Methanocaldococcus infernus ME]|uniref:Methyltransferase domain-containing protein n=1 Tax=Methanocaldococcus infernus (strain DSM 11812 / JCM 15783 / ME) TaxID=573063 RepID=D5VRG0_METIM|nr:class I SAM-dependent methyltransferase [Methanocaldococcus infernus]ADG13163.1 hypothetical protein Metin_0493 [Methanocaldococcus infernus ME]